MKYNEAKQRYISGESAKKIAKDLKMSAAEFVDKLRLDGIAIRGKSSTAIDWMKYSEKVLSLWKQYGSIRKIHEVLKIPRSKISYILKSSGQVVKERGQKYDYREDVFETIDTEHKAYWLGFLYADGYVSKSNNYEVKLSLHRKDMEHLKKFSTFMGNEIPVIGDSNNPNAKRVIVSNKKIHQSLIKLGCMSQKTFHIVFPDKNIVPEELRHHFIRGYFDGDGGLSLDWEHAKPTLVFYMTGTNNFLRTCQDIFGTDNKLKQETENGPICTFRCRGNAKPLKILDYLYKDATIYLERKHSLYQSFKAGNAVLERSGESLGL